MVAPPATPVTTPAPLIVPLLVALDSHEVLLIVPEPPVALVLNGVVNPTHTSFVPVIAPATGNAFIVTAYAALDGDTQPLLSVTVYVILVAPPATPVTTPVFTTVPLLTALDVHAVLLYVPDPPVIVPVFNDVVNPTHTAFEPVIVPATGKGLTIIDNSVE